MMVTTTRAPAHLTEWRAPTTYQDITGWFNWLDHKLFTTFLAGQEQSEPGDLVELGVFMGKSAVVVGDYLRAGERFVVVDLFGDMSLLGSGSDDNANRSENAKSYPRLTRERFERNYLALHGSLPVVVQGPTTLVVDHVEPGQARFIHVDASHLYAGVSADCRNAETLLRPGGVVSFDDWRNAKCPGVAAAVWETMARRSLVPVATTPNKLYAVSGDASAALDLLRALVSELPDRYVSEEHDLLGATVVRLTTRKAASSTPDDDFATPSQVSKGPSSTPDAYSRGGLLSRVADELAPPALNKLVRSRRGRR